MSTHIDCDTCQVRGRHCQDCVVTALIGPPPEAGFDEEESRALSALADGGLVPPLRMVRATPGPDPDGGDPRDVDTASGPSASSA